MEVDQQGHFEDVVDGDVFRDGVEDFHLIYADNLLCNFYMVIMKFPFAGRYSLMVPTSVHNSARWHTAKVLIQTNTIAQVLFIWHKANIPTRINDMQRWWKDGQNPEFVWCYGTWQLYLLPRVPPVQWLPLDCRNYLTFLNHHQK